MICRETVLENFDNLTDDEKYELYGLILGAKDVARQANEESLDYIGDYGKQDWESPEEYTGYGIHIELGLDYFANRLAGMTVEQALETKKAEEKTAREEVREAWEKS